MSKTKNEETKREFSKIRIIIWLFFGIFARIIGMAWGICYLIGIYLFEQFGRIIK